MSTSAWWYSGRLTPPGADFHTKGVPIWKGTDVVVLYDGIAVTSEPGPDAVADTEDARELLDLVAASYALITGHAYEVLFESWVEAEQATFTETTVGFRVRRPPHQRGSAPSPRSRRSCDMRRAARLAGAIFGQPGWRLAIRDVHAAFLDRGDDAFVFAYRALEDAARAVAGRSGQLKAGDWKALRRHLGVTEASFARRIRVLRDARHSVAHGDASNRHLIDARAKRKTVLETSRQLVARAVANSTLPLELNHIRKPT